MKLIFVSFSFGLVIMLQRGGPPVDIISSVFPLAARLIFNDVKSYCIKIFDDFSMPYCFQYFLFS